MAMECAWTHVPSLASLPSGIVSSSGYIKKCMDEQHGDMIVSDLLREMLLNEDSERADLYNDEEQNEFIFHIFKILVMGGSLCQPDDNINVYLDATKQIYKVGMTNQPEERPARQLVVGVTLDCLTTLLP